MNILFFGSTSDSVIVLEKLSCVKGFSIAAVVTQPAKPIGRKQTITPTPVETWAKARNIAVLSFPSHPEKPWLYKNEQVVADTLQPIHADLLISASYGVKIPWETIQQARFGGINVHPSILPYWRGADPVPWAILTGDHQIGVTVVTLSKSFDQGKILAQKKIPIMPNDLSDPLRTKLFTIGADLLVALLPRYVEGKIKSVTPHYDKTLPYAKKFKREDGFEPWEHIAAAMADGTEADRIERKFRALHPWPGVWTTITQAQSNKVTDKEQKRLKISKLHVDHERLVLDTVQLEGKKPVSWQQFQTAYLAS